jgi:hypothetical protein
MDPRDISHTSAHFPGAIEQLFKRNRMTSPRDLFYFKRILVRELGEWRVRLGLIPESR